MQRGMNQTLAWLLAIVLAAIVFGVGGFWVMKTGGHGGDSHEMAAKSHGKDEHGKPEKKAEHGEATKAHPSSQDHESKDDHGEVLRPEH